MIFRLPNLKPKRTHNALALEGHTARTPVTLCAEVTPHIRQSRCARESHCAYVGHAARGGHALLWRKHAQTVPF